MHLGMLMKAAWVTNISLISHWQEMCICLRHWVLRQLSLLFHWQKERLISNRLWRHGRHDRQDEWEDRDMNIIFLEWGIRQQKVPEGKDFWSKAKVSTEWISCQEWKEEWKEVREEDSPSSLSLSRDLLPFVVSFEGHRNRLETRGKGSCMSPSSSGQGFARVSCDGHIGW